MKVCASIQLFITLLLSLGVMTTSFMVTTIQNNVQQTTMALHATPEVVEVCGFKDCRRAGGGARLENLVNTVLEENGLVDAVKVEKCDCQGECGYGPNLVIDGKIANFVKGRDAVVKALKIEEEN